MKKILVVSHGAALGGSPISALNISRYINHGAFRIIYAFGENGPVADLARQEGNTVHIVERKGLIGINSIFQYMNIIWREGIDVVHLNTLTSYYKYPAIAARITGKPIAWFVRENPVEKRCVRLKGHLNWLADCVVTVSFDTAQNMSYVDNGKLMTIHNGVDLAAFQPLDRDIGLAKTGLPPARYLTTIASLEPRKGIDDIIEAFARSSHLLPDVKLLIVGADRSLKKKYWGKLQGMLDRLGLTDRVVFYGESTDIVHIMAASQCIILASYWEGLSRVLLEALACGKPIIASRNGGNKEVVFDGKNGFTFDAGDIEKMSSLLLSTTDNALMSTFGRASRNLAESQFSITRTTERLEKLYTELG